MTTRTFITSIAFTLSLASLAAAKQTHQPVELDPTFSSCEAIDLANGGSALVCEHVAKRAPKSTTRTVARVGHTTVQHIRG